jgi:hypothetical protein
MVPVSTSWTGPVIVGHAAAGVTRLGGVGVGVGDGDGDGEGDGAGGNDPSPGDAMSLAPQADSAAAAQLVNKMRLTRLKLAIKSPIRTFPGCR